MTLAILTTIIGTILLAVLILIIPMMRDIRLSLMLIEDRTIETALQAKRIADAVELGLADSIRCEQARRKLLGKRIAAAIVPAFKEAMKFWKFRFK